MGDSAAAADAQAQHADLRAAHILVSEAAAADTGSDSDLSEYEQEMGRRTATAFDVGAVDPAILDRGVWNTQDHEPAKLDGMQTAGASSLPVRQWSQTPDAAAREPKKALLLGSAKAAFGDKAAFPDAQQHGAGISPPRRSKRAAAEPEVLAQHHLRKLQELNESLKDVQEEMREPKSKNVGLGTLPVQNAGVDWPIFPVSVTLPARRAIKGRKAAKAGAGMHSKKRSGIAALAPPGQVGGAPADLFMGEVEENAYLFQPLLPKGKDRKEVATKLQERQQAGDRKTAGKYIQSVGGNFWSSAQKRDGQWILRAAGGSQTKTEAPRNEERGPEGDSQSLRMRTRDDGRAYEAYSFGVGQEHLQENSIKCSTPVRQVVDAARREAHEQNERIRKPPRRSESLRPTSVSPVLKVPFRSKTNFGSYRKAGCWDQSTLETGEEISDDSPRSHSGLYDDVHLPPRPVFFKSHHLVDPVQIYRDEQRMRKRDGSVRDRLGRGQNEAAIRSELRSVHVSALQASPRALGAIYATNSGVEHVQRELRRALSLLHETGPTRPLSDVAPVTPDIEMRLMLDRMGKGQSSIDVKLAAGKHMCVPPKIQTSVNDSKTDTSKLPTKQMITAHAQMLAEHARHVTKEALKSFKASEDVKLDELRQESWDVVQRWEELLAQLPRIKKETGRLCGISINWQDALVHESQTIQAFLRTGMDDRATKVLNMPEIRNLIIHHHDAYASEMRRKQIRQTLQTLSEKKKELLECSDAVIDLKASAEAVLAPLRQQLRVLNDKITNMGGDRGQEQVAKEQKVLHEKIDHLELSFKNSIQVEALDRISGSIIETFVSMDRHLGEEEACVATVQAEETFMRTVLAKRNAKEAEADLKKKIDYMFKMNPDQVKSVGEILVTMVSRICLEPDNGEWKSINATSRSSPIHAILACKGGFDVLTAFTFYHTGSTWCVPNDVDAARMQVGCEHLCLLLGIPDRILLRRMEKQSGSVATDLLKKMVMSEGEHFQGSLPAPGIQHKDARLSNQKPLVHKESVDLDDAVDKGQDVAAEEDVARGEDGLAEDEGGIVSLEDGVIAMVSDETAEERALAELFRRLDKDGGGSLCADEIKIALSEYNIDDERPSAVRLLEHVESYGEQGMGIGDFKESMAQLLAEPMEEDDPFEGMDEEQVARIKQLVKMLLNGHLTQAWDTWKAHLDKQQIARTGALENYKRVCQVLTISPSISTLFRRFLQSRSESTLSLSNRGMSALAFKAFACGMYGWSPHFSKIEKMSMVPKEYVTAHPDETFAVPCDPCVNVFELRKNGACESLTSLDLSNNAGGPECARDLKQVLVRTFGCLLQLDISDNKIGEDGGRFLAEAMMHDDAPPLVTLRVGHNRMGDKASAQLVASLAGANIIHSLTLLDICANDCGDDTCDQLGKYLSDAAGQLEYLDVGWNLVRGESGAHLFNGLDANTSLKYLNISWNGIDVEACGSLGECLKTCVLEDLDLNHCNITGAGALLIADGLKRNTLLRRITLDCNNLKQSAARALVKASLASGAHVDESGNERVISMVDCNLQSVDSTTFNKAEPAGKYSLDLNDAYDRSTFKELLRLVYEERGAFAPQPMPKVDTYYDGSWKEYKIVIPDQEDEDQWEMPPIGLIEFAFASLLSSDNASEMSSNEIEWLHHELNSPGKTERDRIGAIKAFCEGDNFLRFEQVEAIIIQLPEDTRSLERCELVKQCFSRLTEAERAMEMLQLLTINERKAVEKKLGLTAITFTKNNATGKYVLDLSKKPERDVCIRLCEINNSQQAIVQLIEAGSANRKGGARIKIERTWRNATFEEGPHVFSSTWAVPQKGFLELDFVQITKPTSEHNLTTDEQFVELLMRLRKQNDDEKLVSIKDWLNRKVVLCGQVEEFLTLFKRDKDRIDLMVAAYARVLDWHGYTSLLSLISIAEFNVLVKRIGLVNLFDEVMAVGYHELDLAVADQRFVAQELVHLAMVEPGENMVDCQYNGVDFPLPVGWGVEVPKKGALSFYYCREEPVIEAVLNRGRYESSDYSYAVNGEVPVLHRTSYGVWYLREFLQNGMPQPAGVEWVRHARMRRIKMKMLKSASKAEDMFNLLDNDGGGSLDRKEMAVGLFRLGVWLQPSELAALMEALDEDGGGEIDLAEFSTWWNSTPLLPPRRLKSAASRWLGKIQNAGSKNGQNRHDTKESQQVEGQSIRAAGDSHQ